MLNNENTSIVSKTPPFCKFFLSQMPIFFVSHFYRGSILKSKKNTALSKSINITPLESLWLFSKKLPKRSVKLIFQEQLQYFYFCDRRL